MKKYSEFLDSKVPKNEPCGFNVDLSNIGNKLFPFQKDITRWAIAKGRAAIFADCGLGKTPMQLEWAKNVLDRSGRSVLILAPLSVGQQTVDDGVKFGIEVSYVRDQSQVRNPGIYITNYEMIEHFEPSQYAGIVLDESSILKSFDGKTRNLIIDYFGRTPYRLACTATPAPNDYMELGNHAEFLGVMTRTEMLSMFFVHDGETTSQWRLKGHAKKAFWSWVCSWAVNLRKPSDLGYSDECFILPKLNIVHVTAASEQKPLPENLFVMEARTLDERREARKQSLDSRIAECSAIINQTPGKFLVWCDYNYEQDLLAKTFNGKSISIQGSTPKDDRIEMEQEWSRGDKKILISKPDIFGFGMNWQHCHNVIFCGLSDSYEQFYQAVRRCWRFGQKSKVNCWIVTSENEGAVVANIERKESDANAMAEGMVKNMSQKSIKELHAPTVRDKNEYVEDVKKGKNWTVKLGDCIEAIKEIKSDSIHYTVFSPPFASLYTYSNSERDMGNCKDHKEFYEHIGFLIPQLLRVTMPGRLLSFHCMNLPTSKTRDGVIGISDFRGILIKAFVDAGWIYHSEVCIWKDPVTAMQRTKALGLLHKQIKKDSCMSRQGIADYLVTMRKPGENPERVTHTNETFPVQLWQNYASPVWMDINPSDTLQHRSARENEDERHICPLQLQVIRRAVELWTNPGDLVLSPFAGIGSEGYVAIEMGRKFYGIELKRSYWEQAHRNLSAIENSKKSELLFGVSA